MKIMIKSSLYLICVISLLSCSNQKAFNKLLREQKVVYREAISVLNQNFEDLSNNSSFNPTGKNIILIRGSVENIRIPQEDREVLMKAFDLGQISEILVKDKKLILFEYDKSNGFYTWTTSYLLFNPSDEDPGRRIYDLKYQRVKIYSQSKENKDWYNLVLENTID